MDYDASDIVRRYDRERALSASTVRQWMHAVRAACGDQVRSILDLGCGTGHGSAPLAVEFDACVLAIDPSERMLGRARSLTADERVHYARATAEAIPAADAAIDLAFLSMVYHHLPDPSAAANELARVIRSGGHVCLRQSTVECLNGADYLRYFPRARRIAAAQLPTIEVLNATFPTPHFVPCAPKRLMQIVASNWTAYVERISQRALSDLAQISDDEFACGLRAMNADASKDAWQPVVEPILLLVYRRS